MSIRLVGAAAIAAAVAVIATPVALPATPKTQLCGQIKNGPRATYTMQLNSQKLSGNTWSIFATGVPCAAAMRATPSLLKLWAKAKIEGHFSAQGFACSKESDAHGSSGTAGCLTPKGGLTNIELMMTASYSTSELKRLFYIS